MFLEAVGAEGSEADSSGAKDGAGLPDEGAHCALLGLCAVLVGGGEEVRGFVCRHSISSGNDHGVSVNCVLGRKQNEVEVEINIWLGMVGPMTFETLKSQTLTPLQRQAIPSFDPESLPDPWSA